jgi:hypothetical protein
VPSKEIIIRNNKFEHSGANALIVRAADSPVVEYNLYNHCAVKGSGNASFPFNCDNALFQYNEACYTVYNSEADSWDVKKDADAGGFDSDWNCKNTVIQRSTRIIFLLPEDKAAPSIQAKAPEISSMPICSTDLY